MNENENKSNPLMQFIKETETTQQHNIAIDPDMQAFGPNIRKKVDKIEGISEWIELPLSSLPYSKFYKDNTHIMIRPLATKEIQNFSTVNENNPYDVQLKLNEVFKTCVKFIHPNGELGNYRDIISGDRQTVAIALATITAKNGRKIQLSAKTKNNEEVKIDMVPSNFVYMEEPEIIKPFFNETEKVYVFKGHEDPDMIIRLAPPTIGLEEDMNNYVIYQSAKSNGQDLPPLSFITNVPYIKAGNGIYDLPLDKMDQELYNFQKMNDEYFQIIDDAIDYFKFGIEKVRTKLPTGEVVETSFRYPVGARSLFIIPNAFKQFIGQ
jgi:hypothetical protein